MHLPQAPALLPRTARRGDGPPTDMATEASGELFARILINGGRRTPPYSTAIVRRPLPAARAAGTGPVDAANHRVSSQSVPLLYFLRSLAFFRPGGPRRKVVNGIVPGRPTPRDPNQQNPVTAPQTFTI